MRTFVTKHWFLLTVLVGCVAGWFWPPALEWTDWISPRVVMPLALFLLAVTMDSRSLLAAVRRPTAALWAVVISYVVLPALGWVAGFLLPTDFQIGLLICTCAPCTLASAVIWTRLAGGNEAAALLSTFVSTGISWLTTTAWLTLTTGDRITLYAPALMADLALTLVLPVLLGQLSRLIPVVARVASARTPALGNVSRILVLVILLRAAHDVAVRLHSDSVGIGLGMLALTALLCVVCHLLALGLGLSSARRMGFDPGAQIAVGFAGSQKTLPVSLVILDLYFPAYPLGVVPMLFFHAGQLTADTFIAERWAARHRNAPRT